MYDKNCCCFISKQDFKTILSTRSFDLKPSDYEIDLLVWIWMHLLFLFWFICVYKHIFKLDKQDDQTNRDYINYEEYLYLMSFLAKSQDNYDKYMLKVFEVFDIGKLKINY